jgi:uncharacterized protein YndB with AHSA1/START domain
MICVQTKGDIVSYSIEHIAETELAPERIWRAWSDVDSWPLWNPDVERMHIDGEFAAGAELAMTLKDHSEVRLRIVDAAENERFVDEAEIDGTLFRTLHEIERLPGGRTRIGYRLQAIGPLAEQLGPAIGADFPETIAGLLAYAARAARPDERH